MSGSHPHPVRVLLTCLLVTLIAAAAPALGQNVLCQPDPLEISLADDIGGGVYEETLVVTYTGGGSGAVFGYSLDVTWDVSVVTAGVNDFAKPDSGPFATTDWFIVQILSPGTARIDAALPGTGTGTTSDDLFKVTFTAAGTPDYDTSAVTLTLNAFRDANNVPLTGFTADPGLVEVDLVAPVVSGAAIENTTLNTNDYLKDGDGLSITATVTDGDPAFGTGDFSADLSGFGGSAAAVADSYAAGVATWLVASAACTPADGTITVTVSATDGLGNSASDDDTIIADNTAPTAPTGFTAAPGHKKVDLAWDDASGHDLNFAAVQIQYRAWGDYADYGSQPTPTAAPAYPETWNAGSYVFSGASTSTTHTFVTDDRDIYYYSAFVYDMARNFSPAVNARATNYWLGDVGAGTGPYDGYVDVADVTGLASTYGLDEGDGGWKPECDVGPTDSHARDGIPEPDDQVQFEDLMIFAMNSGLVSPTKRPLVGTDLPVLAWVPGEDGDWSLHLAEPCANLKGLNLSARLDAGAATVSAGALLAQQDGTVFLQNIDRHGLDAGLALMGHNRGLEGAGELVRITLPEGVDPGHVRILARGIGNEDLKVDPQVGTDASAPRAFSLAQNVPNPFNPSTRIVFSLPEAQAVTLSIYTLDGRLVRTLLSEPRGAGLHAVTWNGRDDAGRQAASGTYVYRLLAGPYGETRKMSLMK